MPADPAGPGTSPGDPFAEGSFFFGVATAGFQIEGGFNGPGQPANNWATWELVGRVAQSGDAVGFWDRPEEALDRTAALGCDTFRMGIEWARVVPSPDEIDRTALDRYAAITRMCLDRGLTPLVTLHHFTHPVWLGEDFWLRPDASRWFADWARLAAESLAPTVRHWVTINEINVMALSTYLLGTFPPGRVLGFADTAIAVDNLLCAHVAGYDAIHEARPDAVVTTNNFCLSVYEYDRMLVDLLLAGSLGIERHELDGWIDERRRQHDALTPPPGPGERALRLASAKLSPYGTVGGAVARKRPRRALDTLEASPNGRTLDVLGIDYYDPLAARKFRVPGHRTAGGRNPAPTRELWDDPPDPGGLARWLGAQHALTPDLPLWVVENGMCNRVRDGRSYQRTDGWDRPRYVRENLAAVASAVDAGVPVTGYWHWTLVDNYEWGSYEPRFGLHAFDRDGAHGGSWLATDALGSDSAGTYRQVIAGLRSGDRSVLEAGSATS